MDETYRHGNYRIIPGATQLRNVDGTAGHWPPHAEIQRPSGNEDLVLPVDWRDEFDTAAAAKEFALQAALDLIDSGRCKI